MVGPLAGCAFARICGIYGAIDIHSGIPNTSCYEVHSSEWCFFILFFLFFIIIIHLASP